MTTNGDGDGQPDRRLAQERAMTEHDTVESSGSLSLYQICRRFHLLYSAAVKTLRNHSDRELSDSGHHALNQTAQKTFAG